MEQTQVDSGLFSKMIDSWKAGLFCDVTIKCANLRKIKAPSILLGTVSEKLSDILNQCEDSTFATSEIPYQLWQMLLHILYAGSTDCLMQKSHETVPTIKDMLQFAGCLGIHSVVNLCLKDMKSIKDNGTGYRLVDKIPLEFNLVYFVETEFGKERVTAICQCPLHDPDLLTNKPDTDDQHVKEESHDDTADATDCVTDTQLDCAVPCTSDTVTEGPTGNERRCSQRQRKRTVYLNDVQYMTTNDMMSADDFLAESYDAGQLGDEAVVVSNSPDNKDIKSELHASTDIYEQPYKAKKQKKQKVRELHASDGVLSKKVKVCFVCHSDCEAEFVQCRLCFQVVDGTDLRHVEDEHPVLNNVIWPVTCDVGELTPEEETVMIGRSTMGYVDGGNECGSVYQCMQCIQMFASQDAFDAHLREHTLAVFACQQDGCHFAFKSEVYRTEHQHFCMGGNILKCYACQQILGGMLGYNKHKCPKKSGKAQSPRKAKDIKGVVPVSDELKKKLQTSRRYTKKTNDVEALPKTTGQRQRQPVSRKPIIPKVSEEELAAGYLPLVPSDDQEKTGHLIKCCRSCSFHCCAENVCCLLCGVFLPAAKGELHVSAEHPHTPTDRLWPVDCRDDHSSQESFVICKFTAADVSAESALQNSESCSTDVASAPTTLEVKIEGTSGDTSIVLLQDVMSDANTTGVDAAQCCLCSFTCMSRVELKEHLSVEHQRVVLYCNVCSHGFNDVANRDRHHYYCVGGYMLTCMKCELRTVGDANEAKLHEVEYHRGAEKKKLYIEVDRRPSDGGGGGGRLQRCFVCGLDGCSQTKVKCIYCSQVVDNDMQHMDSEHPFTPPDSVWPVTCRYYRSPGQASIVTGRQVIAADVTYVECTVCGFSADSAEVVVEHVRDKHHAKSSKHCVHCNTVFCKYEAWRDHEHFCSGGDVLACAICGALCGGLKAMNDHICRNHPQQKGRLSQLKPPSRPKKPMKARRNVRWSPDDVTDDDMSFGASEKPDDDVTVSERLCLRCTEQPCSEKLVKCVLCQCKVLSQLSHMKHHPFTPAKRWVVACASDDVTLDSFVLAERIYHGRRMRSVIKCNVCKSFMSHGVKEMAVHLSHAHASVDFYRCTHCWNFLANVLEARDHEHFCGGGQRVVCQQCGVLCGGFRQLIQHVQAAHLQQDGTGPVSDPSSRDQELLVELTPELLAVYFPTHELSWEQNDAALEAVELEESGERPQYCFVCEGKCQVADAKKRKLKCLLCNDTVFNSSLHMREKHAHTPRESPWTVTCGSYRKACDLVVMRQSSTVDPRDGLPRINCMLCSFQTQLGNEEQCVIHFQDIHKSAVYFCKHCYQGFRKPNFKKDHERLCGGLGLPRCSVCARRCIGYDALLEHMKQAHGKADRKKRRAVDDEADDDATNDVKEPSRKLKKQLQSADIDVETAQRDANGFVKMCGSCGTHCVSHDVRCLLCFRVVPASSQHMLDEHPLTPSRTWIVSCKNLNSIRGGWKNKKGNLVMTGHDKFLVGRANQVAVLVPDAVTAVSGDPENDGSDRVPLDISCLLPHSEAVDALETLDGFIQHLRDRHDDLTVKTVQMCSHCNLIFTLHDHYTKMSFIDHVQFCSGRGLYVCEICDVTFSSCRKNNEHMQAKHKDLLEPKHSMTPQVVVPPGQFIQCPECSFKADSFKRYGEHVRETHQYKLTQVQVCQFCFKTFRLCSKRELHEQIEHKGGERLTCNICHRQFNTPTSLRAHTKYYHEGGRIKQKIYRDNKTRIPCSYCGRLFQLGIHVQQHERTAHLNQKPYQCRICGMGFTNHSAWKTHEDRHSGIKRYQCPYCDYRAYKGSRVNEHIKTKHPGRKRAYGNDVIEYNAGDVIAKGDEFIVEGNFSYKPRLRREDFDFGDYEESFLPPEAVASQIAAGAVPAGRDMYIRTLVEGAVPATHVTSAESRIQPQNESLVYMTHNELRAAMADERKMTHLAESAAADNKVQFVVDDTQTLSSVGLQDSGVQYVLEGSSSGDGMHYVVESDGVSDAAKQEVELIINSAVAGASSVTATGGSFLINNTSAHKFMPALQDDNKEQVYLIVNK